MNSTSTCTYKLLEFQSTYIQLFTSKGIIQTVFYKIHQNLEYYWQTLQLQYALNTTYIVINYNFKHIQSFSSCQCIGKVDKYAVQRYFYYNVKMGTISYIQLAYRIRTRNIYKSFLYWELHYHKLAWFSLKSRNPFKRTIFPTQKCISVCTEYIYYLLYLSLHILSIYTYIVLHIQ